MKIQVYDPPMCCSTGVCGPSVDPELVRFAADMDWLKRQGVNVERYNLSQQPKEFAGSPLVKKALAEEGNDCLPLTVADGKVVCAGRYPTREMLAGFAGLVVQPGIFTESVRELVALGAAIASNCEPCFKHHYNEAHKLGVSKEDMLLAIETAQMVKDTPARSIQELADKVLNKAIKVEAVSPCCVPSPLKKGGGKGCC
ncbi:MAG: arsenite efflux transporter metallochaperone ArsD [Acidobacteria bacterium]|nr:arsenite efflux transporter metallochaperone ArsD [Acidobacteriota bacterium]